MLSKARRFDEARIVLGRASAHMPARHPVLFNALSELHKAQGDFEGAIDAAQALAE
jgi:hypothetical protein